MKALLTFSLLFSIFFAVGAPKVVAQQAPHAELTKQVRGMGVNVNTFSWNDGELIPALDLLVDYDPNATPSNRSGGLGARFFRVNLDVTNLAIENNTDPTYTSQLFSNGRFEDCWKTIEYLNSKGITHGIVLSVMGPIDNRLGGDTLVMSEVDAWTTFMAALVNYGINTRGLEIGSFSPFNEPDWNCEEGICADPWVVEAALESLSGKLDAAGLSELRYQAPDTADFHRGVEEYIPLLLGNPIIMSKVADFGLHSYWDGGLNQEYNTLYAMIQNSNYPDVGILVTETGSPGSAEYHTNGNGAKGVMIFEGYDSFWPHHGNNQEFGFGILTYNQSTGIYMPTETFWDLRFTNIPKGPQNLDPPPTDTTPPAAPTGFRVRVP